MADTEVSSFDRFNDALNSLDEQFQDLRERLDDRRKKVEKDLRDRADRIQTDLRKTAVYQRAEQTMKDLEGTVQKTRTQVYDAVGLASKADVDRLNRKLNTISKKVNELLKEQASS